MTSRCRFAAIDADVLICVFQTLLQQMMVTECRGCTTPSVHTPALVRAVPTDARSETLTDSGWKRRRYLAIRWHARCLCQAIAPQALVRGELVMAMVHARMCDVSGARPRWGRTTYLHETSKFLVSLWRPSCAYNIAWCSRISPMHKPRRRSANCV